VSQATSVSVSIAQFSPPQGLTTQSAPRQGVSTAAITPIETTDSDILHHGLSQGFSFLQKEKP